MSGGVFVLLLCMLSSSNFGTFALAFSRSAPHSNMNERKHEFARQTETSHLLATPMASHTNSHTSPQTLQELVKATQKRARFNTYFLKVTVCMTTIYHHLSPITIHYHPWLVRDQPRPSMNIQQEAKTEGLWKNTIMKWQFARCNVGSWLVWGPPLPPLSPQTIFGLSLRWKVNFFFPREKQILT